MQLGTYSSYIRLARHWISQGVAIRNLPLGNLILIPGGYARTRPVPCPWGPHLPLPSCAECRISVNVEVGGVWYLVLCRENRWETCAISGSDMFMQCKYRHSISTSRLLGTRQRLTHPVFQRRFQGTGRSLDP